MAETTNRRPIEVRDLGRVRYADAMNLQQELNQSVIDGDAPQTLLLVEHEAVVTVTPRPSASENLIASPSRLEELGIEVSLTNRGGDVTYHGPGQLVAYPIINLNNFGLNLSSYMRLLEQVVIDTAGAFGVEGFRIKGQTGVWVATQNPDAPAKLCAFGVRIRKHVTMHGLALNVATNLAHFETIVPCGLENRAVTSLAQQLGAAGPTMEKVKAVFVDRFMGALTR